ncbi:WD40-repeat-containing domain protein [Lactifluus volemus]|nr:WD40-repeat-containing domain protein [Lactifluus volemus]
MDSLVSKAKTDLPRSLKTTGPAPEKSRKYNYIANKKLRTTLHRQSANSERSKALLKDAELLLPNDAGNMEDEIVSSVSDEAARGRKEFVLDGGPYRAKYTRNGRHMAVVGQRGHVATFDWRTGTMHSELQLRETCRDITYVLSKRRPLPAYRTPSFLQDHSHYAVAQKKYVFIYDRDGVELHRLKSHVEPTRLEFLPFHWLLATVGNTGFLKYQDTSTGQLVAEHRTKLGACVTMTQNVHNAVIYLGHQNGTVTLWTPNLPQPAVRLLAHLGPVCSVAVDPSAGGRYLATAGVDGMVKVWDCRSWKEALRSWNSRGGHATLAWSQRGCLAVASGGAVNVSAIIFSPSCPILPTPRVWLGVFTAINTCTPPRALPTSAIPDASPARETHASVAFCPFQDVLAIGHAAGVSCILVPGSGEPNFDSTEADPFEGSKARREREVKSLLDKVLFTPIHLPHPLTGHDCARSGIPWRVGPAKQAYGGVDPDNVAFSRQPRLERLRIQGKADETEVVSSENDEAADGPNGEAASKLDRLERQKRKTRGKGKSLKRYLRKQRKNVIDPRAVAVREQLAKQRAERERTRARVVEASAKSMSERPSALDRFHRRP